MHKINCTGSWVGVGKLFSAIFNRITTLINSLLMQLETIAERNLTIMAEEFHVTENKREVVKELCRIVAYYHLVEAIDNSSDIYSKLRKNALDALTYWVSLLLLPTYRIAIYIIIHKIKIWMSLNLVMFFYMKTTYCMQ